MSQIRHLDHRFVEAFPDRIEPGILYIAIEFSTMSHLCCCGCGSEVVTPLSPKDWKMIFDGETVSVDPSIGSWSLPCQSHYFIRSGSIRWAGKWTAEQIQEGRDRDLAAKRNTPMIEINPKPSVAPDTVSTPKSIGTLERIRRWLFR